MRSYFNITIIFFSFIAISTTCFCQNETGSRTIDKERWQSMKFWYDSSTAMFQVKYPIIRSIPPLSSGMPPETLFSNIYLDSLLRFTNDITLRSKIKSWGGVNDTLRQAVRYLYRIVYNPIFFNQYSDEVSLYYKSSEYVATKSWRYNCVCATS